MQHMSRFGGVAPVNHQMPHAGGATAFDMRMAHAPVRLILFADTPVAPCISTCSWASAVRGLPAPTCAARVCAHFPLTDRQGCVLPRWFGCTG